MSNPIPPPPTAPPGPQVVYIERPKKKRRLLRFILIGLAVLIGITVIASLASGGDEATSPSPGSSEVSTTSERATIAYDTILADIDGMTDAQFDAYAKEAKSNNRAERWTATVVEVDDQAFGSEFFAHLTVGSGGAFDLFDISIDIPEDVALSLNKGDEITFSGEIKEIRNTLDIPIVYLNKVTVHE